jgi:hypothetical protein
MHCFISVFVGHCFLFFLGLKRRATLVTLVAVFSLGTICLHAQRSKADSIQKATQLYQSGRLSLFGDGAFSGTDGAFSGTDGISPNASEPRFQTFSGAGLLRIQRQ